MKYAPLLLGCLLIVTGFLLTACKPKVDYTTFAACLKDKGVNEYGAFWCPHCANQAKLFGKSSKELPFYKECDPRGENSQAALCLDKHIEGFPTWEFADGTRKSGETPLEELAKKTGCELPKPPTE